MMFASIKSPKLQVVLPRQPNKETAVVNAKIRHLIDRELLSLFATTELSTTTGARKACQ